MNTHLSVLISFNMLKMNLIFAVFILFIAIIIYIIYVYIRVRVYILYYRLLSYFFLLNFNISFEILRHFYSFSYICITICSAHSMLWASEIIFISSFWHISSTSTRAQIIRSSRLFCTFLVLFKLIALSNIKIAQTFIHWMTNSILWNCEFRGKIMYEIRALK